MEFDAPELIEAVAAAGRRGVKVRVHAQQAGRGGVSDNAAARAALQAAGVEVADAPHKLSVVHEKSLVIDDASAAGDVLRLVGRRPGRGARLRGADHAPARGRRDRRLLRRRLAAPALQAARQAAAGVGAAERARARGRVHRRRAPHAGGAERALPGPGDDRAPGARAAPRRGAAADGACGAPHGSQGDHHRRGRAAHAGRPGRAGAAPEAPAAARQHAAGRRRTRAWSAR